MQNQRPSFFAVVGIFAAFIVMAPITAVAQAFPDYLPKHYRSFFKYFVDERSLPEAMLNLTGLTSRDYGRGFALIAGVAKYPATAGPARNLTPAPEDVRKMQKYTPTA